MGLLSTAVMVKREDGSENFPVVPPGFSASDSTPAMVKRKVSGDDKSAVDDVDHLPLKQRMRMLDVGGVSCSSLGIESRRKITTYCVDEAVIEEARPLKVAAGGALPVADRAYIRSESGARLVGTGASMSDPSCRRMHTLIEPSHQSDESAHAPDQANSSTAKEQEEGEENEDEDEEYVAPRSVDEQLARMKEQLNRLEKRISKIYSIVKKILCCVQKEGETPPPYSADE